MKSTDSCIHISFRREDFRIALGRPFWLVAVGALSASELMHILPGTENLQTLLVTIPTAVIVLCTLILLAMCLVYRLRVGPEGICCFDLWLRPRHARWGSITGARLCRAFGLEYLRVTVRERDQALWIPLFVKRDRLFRDLLMAYSDAARGLDADDDDAG